jgi:hypothetical protein
MLFAWLAALPAVAIPAFARRYKTSCTTCHTLPPQLNPFGAAFRINGFRLPSGEERRQDQDVQLGAPEWEALFPNAILPGSVSDVPPFAGLLRSALVSAPRVGRPRSEDISILGALLLGGNLGKRASGFVEAGFTGAGAALNRAWLSVDRIAGGPWLNVRAGRVEPAIVPWSRYMHRLTYSEYLPFETRSGTLELGATRPAVEIFGAGSDPGPLRGLRYTAGLAARDASGLTADAYGRVSYKFGGVAAAGDRSATASGPPVAPLRESSLQLGAFVYRATLGGPATRPRALRAGADATLDIGRLGAMAGGWIGDDDALAGTPWSWLLGASARPWPWLMLMGRYEALFTPGNGLQRRVVASVRGALQQNVALTLESQIGIPDASVGAIASLFLAL